MISFEQEIIKIRERILNTAILATLIFVVPAVVTSLLRIKDIGWYNIYILHTLIPIFISGLYLFRNILSLNVRAHLFINMFLAVALVGLLSFSLVGGYYLAFVSIILGTIIYGRKTGLVYLLIYLLGFIIIGYLQTEKILFNQIDYAEYLSNKLVWASQLIGQAFGLLVIIYSASLFYKLFTHTISSLLEKTRDLEYKEERFRIFMDNYPFPITIKNESLNFVFGNKRIFELIGLNESEVKSTADEIFPKEVAEVLRDADQTVLEEKRYVEVNVEGDIEENNRQYFKVIKFPLKGPQGETLIGSITINRTAQRLAEKKLEISEKKYRSIFEGSLDGFAFVDSKNIIQECNNSFCNMLGYTKEEILHKSVDDITHPDCIEFERNLLFVQKLEEEGFSGLYEKIFINKSGVNVPVELNLHKLDLGGENFYWSVNRDMSERKEMDQQLFKVMIESEERERERYAKELHDGLGPLLSTCKIYFHTLNKVKEESKRQEFAKRADELLEDALITIKEISNNLSPDILRKYGLVQALIAFTNKLKAVTSINFIIESDLDERLLETVEFTIYRTLIELINNSVKHGNPSEISIRIHGRKNTLRIAYSDNGKGFDYDKIKTEHMGFGLLNLENRIRKIGGDYSFISSPGKGVNVYFSLKIFRI